MPGSMPKMPAYTALGQLASEAAELTKPGTPLDYLFFHSTDHC